MLSRSAQRQELAHQKLPLWRYRRHRCHRIRRFYHRFARALAKSARLAVDSAPRSVYCAESSLAKEIWLFRAGFGVVARCGYERPTEIVLCKVLQARAG